MSNHARRSRSQFYGVDRLHARPARAHRGHGTTPPDPWRNDARKADRSYAEALRDRVKAALARLGIGKKDVE